MNGTATSEPAMSFIAAFGIGCAGAFFVYAVKFRAERLKDFLSSPKDNWRVLLFDLILFIAMGGVATAFLMVPKGIKEGFIGGMGWEGLVVSAVPTKPSTPPPPTTP